MTPRAMKSRATTQRLLWQRRRSLHRRFRPVRSGMTLVEVMMALSIAMITLLGFGAFLMRFMHTSSKGTLASAASDLAVSRIEAAKSNPTYAGIPAAFNGTQSGFSNCTGCTMTTVVTQTSTTTNNYMTITVTVTAPNLPSTVKKTTSIAQY